MAAAAAGDHPDQAALHIGQELQADLEQGKERKPADDHHPVPDRGAARTCPGGMGRQRDGRVLHALRQSVHAGRAGPDGQGGLPADRVPAALSAICGGDLGHGQRSAVPCGPHLRTLFRPARLHLGPGRIGAPHPGRQGTRQAGRQLSRDAQTLSAGGRSLSLPVPEDLSPAERGFGLARRRDRHDLPVRLRNRGMVAPLYRRTRGRTGETRHHRHRGDLSRFLLGLHRDAGGDQRRDPRKL